MKDAPKCVVGKVFLVGDCFANPGRQVPTLHMLEDEDVRIRGKLVFASSQRRNARYLWLSTLATSLILLPHPRRLLQKFFEFTRESRDSFIAAIARYRLDLYRHALFV